MIEADVAYLKNALGIDAETRPWESPEPLPLHVKAGLTIWLAQACGIQFLLAEVPADATLPDLKRIHAQLSKRVPLQVAVSAPRLTARQRTALVSQGIPFVCAGRQASLPFLGAASTEWGKKKLEAPARRKLSPKAQQAAIWGALRHGGYSLVELKDATGMSASQASEAVSELVRKGLASCSKHGRMLTVQPLSEEELLGSHMDALATPILKKRFVEATPTIDRLPDAGESALAACSVLAPPSIRQKAASRKMAKELAGIEILEGELPDTSTVEVQLWKYGPLFTGQTSIDRISLALSLATTDDERIAIELDTLFGKEYPWERAKYRA